VVAIDGPAAAGKGTVARLVARRLGFLFVDSGAMYRAITLKALKAGINLSDETKIKELAARTKLELFDTPSGYRVLMDGEDISREIRDEEVSRNTHYIASCLAVREILWQIQRYFRKKHHLVMEGRDISTKVFPDAQVKIYLDASLEERARRRYLQLKEKGLPADLEAIKNQMLARDQKDLQRSIAPLICPPDAHYLDTTGMSIEQVVDAIMEICRQKGINSS